VKLPGIERTVNEFVLRLRAISDELAIFPPPPGRLTTDSCDFRTLAVPVARLA
jgi:hypothetical protein